MANPRNDMQNNFVANDNKEESKTTPPVDAGLATNSFFKKNSDIKVQWLQEAAEDILMGSTDDAPRCLALVQEHPELLKETIIAKDPRGRNVQGTLLQIAAMAGDFDLMNRLTLAGKLSQDEIIQQLQVLTSPEAVQKNSERNHRILEEIIKFGETIRSCSPITAHLTPGLVEEFATNLKSIEEKEIITSGYIFDLEILIMAANWFKDNIKRFNLECAVQPDLFWVSGFIYNLQVRLPVRDAAFAQTDFNRPLQGKIASRSSDNYTNPFSSPDHALHNLGHDYYTYTATMDHTALYGWVNAYIAPWEKLKQAKNEVLEKILNVQRAPTP